MKEDALWLVMRYTRNTEDGQRTFPHSTKCSGGARHCSTNAPGGAEGASQDPLPRGDWTACHFSPTLPGRRGSTWRREQGGEGRSPGEPRRGAAWRRRPRLPQAPVARAGVGSGLQPGAGPRHPGGGTAPSPARLLVGPPAPPPCPRRGPSHAGERSGTVPSPLPERHPPEARPRSRPVPPGGGTWRVRLGAWGRREPAVSVGGGGARGAHRGRGARVVSRVCSCCAQSITPSSSRLLS